MAPGFGCKAPAPACVARPSGHGACAGVMHGAAWLGPARCPAMSTYDVEPRKYFRSCMQPGGSTALAACGVRVGPHPANQ